MVISPSPGRAGGGLVASSTRTAILRGTSPISSLQAKLESENPEFPWAWKQLLKFLLQKLATRTRADPSSAR